MITFFRHIQSQNIAKPDNLTVFYWEQEHQKGLNGKVKIYLCYREVFLYIVSSSFQWSAYKCAFQIARCRANLDKKKELPGNTTLSMWCSTWIIECLLLTMYHYRLYYCWWIVSYHGYSFGIDWTFIEINLDIYINWICQIKEHLRMKPHRHSYS